MASVATFFEQQFCLSEDGGPYASLIKKSQQN